MHGTDTETKKILREMLTENTGRHMLDSGGAYGRHWEKNQALDFDSNPECEMEARVYQYKSEDTPHMELNVTHDVYHWLEQAVCYNQELDEKFVEYENLPENKDEGYLSLMESFPEWAFPGEVSGIYGDGHNPITVNTYNHESMLSQVLQFTYWEVDGEGYCLLQIHGGCDVRGGYTKPRAFDASIEGDPVGIFDDHRYGIGCTHCSAIWSEDSGEWNGSDYAEHIVPSLRELYAIEGTQSDAEANCTDKLKGNHDQDKLFDSNAMLHAKATRIEDATRFVLEDEKVYCPVCGEGELNAYFY